MRALAILLLFIVSCLPAQALGAGLRISASIYPVWLMVRQVAEGVPGVKISLVLSAGTGCPHDYALTPRNRKVLAETDILVINGLGMENFLGHDSKAILGLISPGGAVVDASQNVQGILPGEEQNAEGAGMDPHHALANPHIFASPSMVAQMVLSIGAQLARLDPAHATQYMANARAGGARFNTLAEDCRAAGASLARRHILAQHDIFSYLARDMGLTIDGYIQKHDGYDPSAREMLDLARIVRKHGTAAVLTEPQYPGRSGNALARETGIPCVEIDPVASGPEDVPGDYYEQAMRKNMRILEGILGK